MVAILTHNKFLGLDKKAVYQGAAIALGTALTANPFVGAAIGGGIHSAISSGVEGRRAGERAVNVQNDSAAYTKKVKADADKKLAYQQSKLNKQLAQNNASRVRGGVFGGGTGSLGSAQQSTTAASNPNLG